VVAVDAAEVSAGVRARKEDVVWCCPRCGATLEVAEHLVRCAVCGPSPVLGGVPLLLSDVAGYCRTFRDSILAGLAEHDELDRHAVTVVDAFARGGRASELFADDWTEHEGHEAPPPRSVRGPSAKTLARLQAEAARAGPAAWLASKLRGVRAGSSTLELGCGAGERSEVLARTGTRLFIADRSLRAVLHARARARRANPAADVEGAVLDAEELPLRPRAVDLVIAEHVVDLLDRPQALLTRARAALRRGGRVLLTTPDPGLRSGDDSTLATLAREARLRVKERRDGLPWLRVNSSRFVEVYLVQALELVAG
jgi:SAM-dependent methyltransferase